MKAVNLLPSDMRAAARRGKAAAAPAVEAVGGAGPFLVLGALALCVLAMAAYVLAANTVTERQSELAQVTAEQQAMASRAAALKPYGDFQDMAIRRQATVASLASLRFDWERALRDVSHALPGGVTLSSLDGTISNKDGAGGQLRGAIASPAITLKGCTRNQSSVATMLSRLRGVRGVTRVSLGKSERIKTSASSTGEVGPCGPGSPPQFEVVVFFERSVAATVPGEAGTTAAATGAATTKASTAGANAQPAAGAPTATATPAP
jgi:Tfp pilus assembly protein PilN